MDKIKLLNLILQSLTADLEVSRKASKVAHEAATHEESKPEDAYDTRGLEASYLADAQAKRASDLESMIQDLRAFRPRNFTDDDEISVGALVQIEVKKMPPQIYFVLPFGAGVQVKFENSTVVVITPNSPMGRELMGKLEGDEGELPSKSERKTYSIKKVS